MERDYFTFYRSFYEAVRELPSYIRLEVFTAIIEYGLYGTLTQDMKPTAKAIFTLVKPNIDSNISRIENGKKGGRGKTAKTAEKTSEASYSLTFDEEIAVMTADNKWIDGVCRDYDVRPDDVRRWLSEDFLRNCKSPKRAEKKHDSLDDARSHFLYWMERRRKAEAHTSAQPSDEDLPLQQSDYSYNGGFGSMDT